MARQLYALSGEMPIRITSFHYGRPRPSATGEPITFRPDCCVDYRTLSGNKLGQFVTQMRTAGAEKRPLPTPTRTYCERRTDRVHSFHCQFVIGQWGRPHLSCPPNPGHKEREK
jgi:hypothetical protein